MEMKRENEMVDECRTTAGRSVPILHTDTEGKQVVDLACSFPAYRLKWEADGVTKLQSARGDWLWRMEIRGRNGLVHPFGGELLCAVSRGARIGAKLRALPCVLAARGDEETVVRFHVDHAEAVFAIIKPFRRRHLTPEQRTRAAERLRAFQIRQVSAHVRATTAA